MTTDIRGDYITKQIQEIQTSLDTPPPPPTPTITEERVDEEGDNISRRIQEIQRRLYKPTREEEQLIKHYEEEIKNYQKRIDEKTIILNYILSNLIWLRQLKDDITTIEFLEEEFHKIKIERDRAEEMVNKFKEHIRFLQN